MTSYTDYGAFRDYAPANFQNNYQLSHSFVSALKAPFTTQDRILISESQAFQNQVADFDTLLASQGSCIGPEPGERFA